LPLERLTIALVTDVFPDAGALRRLREHLEKAGELGARLAVLPELPLNEWAPLSRQPRDEDAEAPDGPRHQALANAARTADLAVLGGAIVRDPDTGCRHNTALLLDRDGEVLLRYRKIHLPDEEGFRETSHYDPGDYLPAPARLAGWNVGVQICSDVNRPQGVSAVAALGAEAILMPRATPPESYPRWRRVLRANAVTSCAYGISVNRLDAVMGGPSIAIGPSGDVLLETTDPVAVVTITRAALEAARREYPGYLDVRADVYEKAWRRVARAGTEETESG